MITDNYIKMCVKLENVETVTVMKPTLIGDSYIWLPTLEQLFEMVDWDNYKIAKCKKEYFCWFADPEKEVHAEWGDHYLLYEYKSIQEVILSIVMYEKYHKVWTGEKWEAIK